MMRKVVTSGAQSTYTTDTIIDLVIILSNLESDHSACLVY